MMIAANNWTIALGNAGNSLPFDLDQSSTKPTSNIKKDPMNIFNKLLSLNCSLNRNTVTKNPKNIEILASWGVTSLCIFLSFGLSTKPIFNASLKIGGIVIKTIAKDIKKTRKYN